ncbi:hypothetical protein [Leptotrichia sp. oral taxon 879]|uniref:hypothetical protein n=1 Tax=Leptotrichia sp. oral taxon 879 TaxID=1227267 RepID=UPI0003AD8F46|nr:hypothetical protein [Leptotrichia sp. oral taxon 879]ERK47878.1 hypothetical protein HMPREF1552_02230 [Leptotrichia sp. oral taxon 879 str. F0557]
MGKTKKIEKLYNEFLTEQQIKSPKFISNIGLILSIIAGGVITWLFTIGVFILLMDKLPIKELKVLISSVVSIIVLYLLVSALVFLFSDRIEKYNQKLKEESSNKKFLEWILENGKIDKSIEFKKINKQKKAANDVIFWLTSILISGGIISYKTYSESINFLKQKDEIIYVMFVLIPFIFKDRIKEGLNKKKMLEKQNLKTSNYVKKYFENVEIFEEFLDIDIKNEELVFKYINKSKLEKIEDKLKKIKHTRKKNELIFFVKLEYLKIF